MDKAARSTPKTGGPVAGREYAVAGAEREEEVRQGHSVLIMPCREPVAD